MVTSRPVKTLINCKISQMPISKTMPRMALVKVFWALSVAFGSPPEVIYLNPPQISIRKKTTTASSTALLTTLEKTVSRSFKVAGFPPVGSDHGGFMIEFYVSLKVSSRLFFKPQKSHHELILHSAQKTDIFLLK